MNRILLVQPPFVQLNGPYPAPYYLKSFFASRGLPSRISDHSIGLFESIFCRQGLEQIFAAAERCPSVQERLAAGDRAQDQIAFNLFRFLSQRDQWLSSIDRLLAFLRGNDREFAHLLALANGSVPSGPRLDAFLDSVGANPDPNDAGRMASLLLADIADFITVALDPSFALVRYAESLASSLRSFAGVEAALDGWILRTFYGPLLEAEWDRVEEEAGPTAESPVILACTIPFPGCLAGALFAARSAKARFGDRARTVAGGGYPNTELRSIASTRFFDFFDYLSFDRGYGSLEAILEEEALLPGRVHTGEALYRTIRKTGNILSGSPDDQADIEALSPGDRARHAETDRISVSTIFPDYVGVDFSRYIRPVDDENPMHRLWSEGHWLKAYLAHGCYWHACAFCDVQLDYIRGFAPVDVEALFRHLVRQADATGVRGVHLVDEAAPPRDLLRLAELNREAGLPLSFWGNIRFEKDFTPGLAAVLAEGGLLAVSAGIEVASEQGFKRIGKGIGLREVVNACAAFKESGVLTHAYLIYGYWDEDEQEIVDSAETLRQLFTEGLLDSAFWHKFVLTRHSRVYREWKNGRHPSLKPIEREHAGRADFADNDLAYEGEDRSSRWTEGLDRLLSACMAGNAATVKTAAAFPFKIKQASIPKDLVFSLLADYAAAREGRLPIEAGQKVIFLGSRPLVLHNTQTGTELGWIWHLEPFALSLAESQAQAVAALLKSAALKNGLPREEFENSLAAILGQTGTEQCLTILAAGGLEVV